MTQCRRAAFRKLTKRRRFGMFSARFPRGPLTPPTHTIAQIDLGYTYECTWTNAFTYTYVVDMYMHPRYRCVITWIPRVRCKTCFFSFGFVGIQAAANESPDRRENYFRRYKITMIKIIMASTRRVLYIYSRGIGFFCEHYRRHHFF